MIKCRKCGAEFATKAIINGVKKNLGGRRFCLSCSPHGAHNTRADIDKPKCQHKKGSAFYVKKFRARNKELAVQYLGGKCSICGYEKCLKAMQFHHRNPEEKDFHISERKNWSFERIKPELDKCVLLCANCHCEVHSEMVEMARKRK